MAFTRRETETKSAEKPESTFPTKKTIELSSSKQQKL